MQKETLEYIDRTLTGAGVPYEYGNEWTGSEIPRAFVTGTYTEQPYDVQSGKQMIDFTLTAEAVGGTWGELNDLKDKIMQLFLLRKVSLSNGTLLCIAFQTAAPIPSAAYNVKRMEIRIKITEWSVTQNV